MAVPTPAPIKRGLVRRLRQSAGVMAAISGGISQGFAPRKARYPFITYQVVTAPNAFTWGATEIRCLVDVFAWAENSAEAENLDALIAAALDEAPLDVGEQTLIQCRRIGATPTGPTTDGTGRRVYQIGSIFEIWTNQE